MGKENFWERTSLNIVTNVAGTIFTASIGLFLIPYYLEKLGSAVYGVLPLAMVSSSYALIISDSLSSACRRYVTLAIRGGNEKESSKAFNTAFFGTFKVCLIFVPITLAVSYFSPEIFNVPSGIDFEVQMMFAMVFISSITVSFLSTFNCIFLAYNKMYLIYMARLIYMGIRIAIIFALFDIFNPTLTDIGIAYLVSSIALFILIYFLYIKIRGNLRIRHSEVDHFLFKKMGSLSLWRICTRGGNLMYIEFSLIIVNLYLGSEIEAGFAIVSTIISMISTAVISISAPIEPILYSLYSEKRESDIIETIHVAQKCLGFIMAMPIAFLMIFSSKILTAWVGSSYVHLSSMVFYAAIASFANCCARAMTDVPMLYLNNKSTVVSIFVFGIINVIMSIVVLQFTDWGAAGVMAIWAISYSIKKFMFMGICVKITNAKWHDYLLPVAQSYFVLMACIIVLYGFSLIIDIGAGWFMIILTFFVIFSAYAATMFQFFITKKEKSIVSNILPKFLKRIIVR